MHHLLRFSAILFVFVTLSSCQKEDKRRPDVNEVSLDGATSQVTVFAGEPVILKVVVEDNMELRQCRAEFGPVGSSGIDYDGDWSDIIVQDLAGENDELVSTVTVPDNARGSFQVSATAVDEQGLQSAALVLNFDVENDVTPFLSFGGSIPGPEEDNNTIIVPIGESFSMIYSAEDSDGVDNVVLKLIDSEGTEEYTETLQGEGEILFGWLTDDIFPQATEAASYTFTITATDQTGLTSQALHNILVE